MKLLRSVVSLCTSIAVLFLMFFSWIDLSSEGSIVYSYTGWDLITSDSGSGFGNMETLKIGATSLLIFAIILVIVSILSMAKNNKTSDLINKICFVLLAVSALVSLFGIYIITEEYIESPNAHDPVISYGFGLLITIAVTYIAMMITSSANNKQ